MVRFTWVLISLIIKEIKINLKGLDKPTISHGKAWAIVDYNINKYMAPDSTSPKYLFVVGSTSST